MTHARPKANCTPYTWSNRCLFPRQPLNRWERLHFWLYRCARVVLLPSQEPKHLGTPLLSSCLHGSRQAPQLSASGSPTLRQETFTMGVIVLTMVQHLSSFPLPHQHEVHWEWTPCWLSYIFASRSSNVAVISCVCLGRPSRRYECRSGKFLLRWTRFLWSQRSDFWCRGHA